MTGDPRTGDSRTRDPRKRARDLLGAGLQPYAVAEDGLPVLARCGQGAHLTDTTGRRLIDWNMGFGSLLLGYRRPEVEEAIREQLAAGTLFSVPHELEVEVAEMLCARIPCAEKVAFGKNGSDVCTAAVRVARAVTGRPGILQFGYHGFHDWCAVLNPEAAGVPQVLQPLVFPLPYNDPEAIEAIFAAHGAEIAAVIMEPFRAELPAAGFLARVAEVARRHGALFVLDEMVTGFRLGPGGAQAAFGVTPDLACVGKALANGLPLSALVGRAELVDAVSRTGYGMTARGEALAFAAARAALLAQDHSAAAEAVRRSGEAVGAAFAASCARHGIEGALVGHPAMQGVSLPPGIQEPFLAECRARGVFTNGHLLPSTAHDAAVVEQSCAVFDAALAACRGGPR